MEDYNTYKNRYNDYGIKVDIFLASDPIKPYHIKDSILSFKDVKRLKKK